jgi:hypothetical protein
VVDASHCQGCSVQFSLFTRKVISCFLFLVVPCGDGFNKRMRRIRYHLLNPVSLIEEHHGWCDDLFRGDLMMFSFACATWFRSLAPRAAKLTKSRNTKQIH